MHIVFSNKKVFAGILFFVFCTFLAASFYVKEARSNYALKTEVLIAQQETKLAALAQLLRNNGADTVVSGIIKDCSTENRARFDVLLSRLSELSASELEEIGQLFNACGDFFAERKAVMAARFEREFEVYRDLLELYTLIDEKAQSIIHNPGSWESLVTLEKKRSQLLTELVVIQGEIIASLRAQTPVTDDRLQQLLVEGQQTKDALALTTEKIDQLHVTELDL